VLPVMLCGLLQSVVACFCDIRELVSFIVSLLLLSYSSVCVAVIVLQYSNVRHAADKSSADKDLSSSQCKHQISKDANDDFSLSHRPTVSETSTDANKGNEEESLSNTTCENGKYIEESASAASISEDEPISTTSDYLLPDDTRSVASRFLLPRCVCLESFMMCKSHICIKAALALMLMSMLGLAFVLIYGIVPLESGLWWSVVLVAITSCGAVFFMCIICFHRQTLQTVVLAVSIFSFRMFYALLAAVYILHQYVVCALVQHSAQTAAAAAAACLLL